MLNGVILPGEQRFNEERWAEDILNKCDDDDHQWGYTIHIVKELRTCDLAVFTDRVLYNLMQMGVMDWDGENVQMNQSTQAMRFTTVIASRIIWIANTDHTNVST